MRLIEYSADDILRLIVFVIGQCARRGDYDD